MGFFIHDNSCLVGNVSFDMIIRKITPNMNVYAITAFILIGVILRIIVI